MVGTGYAKKATADDVRSHVGNLSEPCWSDVGNLHGWHYTAMTLPDRGTQHVAWIILFLAGLLEIAWAVGLKYSEGFTRTWPTIGTIVAMLASIMLLEIAMRTLPVGTAYSVWVGIGAVGTVIAGILLWNEPVNAARMISVALIIAGVIGLKFTTPD
jgi:quaternary ammonium compound-resistance protein SugE